MSAVRPLRSLANVAPLHPIRLLLVGGDARWLRAVDFLLTMRGYETRRAAPAASLVREATRFDADVVVVDASRGFAQAARRAGELAATLADLGVVVAAERELPRASERTRFVEKWAPFEALAEAIEQVWAELPPRPTLRAIAQ
ncbi:MAG TPA: hypothetical protein VFA82_03560 [Gaiellaceae bacterium]|nr:hypothetical protein [Gaiellaceae bacterium]